MANENNNKKKAKTKRSVGISELLEANFVTYPFEDEWLKSFGEPEKNFKLLMYGRPKQGKTEMAMKLSKYLTNFGHVYYNSFEQGKSKSLQDAAKRNNIEEVAGKLVFGNRDDFETMKQKLKNGKARFCIIDSRDYINLTFEQWKELLESFKHKSFIILCWEQGGKPKGDHAQSIMHTVDIAVHVSNFRANCFSRFGGNDPFIIWNKAGSGQSTLF